MDKKEAKEMYRESQIVIAKLKGNMNISIDYSGYGMSLRDIISGILQGIAEENEHYYDVVKMACLEFMINDMGKE